MPNTPYGPTPYGPDTPFRVEVPRGFMEPEREEHDTLSLDAEPEQEPLLDLSPPLVPGPRPASEDDRVWPHLLWEVLLLGGCALTVFLLTGVDADALSGNRLDGFLVQLAFTVLLTSGLALSLRAAVPNLAVGAIAVGAGALTAWLVAERGWGHAGAIVLVLLAAGLLGLLLAVVVVGLNVPAWATTLGVAAALIGLVLGLLGSGGLVLGGNAPDPASWSVFWIAVAVGLSVVGGLALLVRPWRRFVGAARPTSDPARRPGPGAATGATVGLVGSSLLAAAAGVLQMYAMRGAFPSGDSRLTALALGAALLGGVSVYGRRAGVFGVVLGSALLTLLVTYLNARDADPWVSYAVFGAAVVLGLVVNRVLEAVGRRKSPAPYAQAVPL
ncbi:MAG TPA: hypothetical protein VGR21_01675 [Cryptosporangiaceae bacterium]|nr:hypothetical protein [Cryptosporangiaceae bacterium]